MFMLGPLWAALTWRQEETSAEFVFALLVVLLLAGVAAIAPVGGGR